MKLVYTATGKPVVIGDRVKMHGGGLGTVVAITKPRTPASTGRVVMRERGGIESSYFPGVIDADWVDREDRPHTLTLSTSDGKWRVLYDGSPVCADTHEQTARDVLKREAAKLTTARVSFTVLVWNGDTRTETAFDVADVDARIAKLQQEFSGAYHVIAPDGSVAAFSVTLKAAAKLAKANGWELR